MRSDAGAPLGAVRDLRWVWDARNGSDRTSRRAVADLPAIVGAPAIRAASKLHGAGMKGACAQRAVEVPGCCCHRSAGAGPRVRGLGAEPARLGRGSGELLGATTAETCRFGPQPTDTWPCTSTPVATASGHFYRALSAGAFHTCAVEFE